MILLLLIVNCFAIEPPIKKEWHIIELNQINLAYKDFFPNGSDPLITQNGIPNRTLGKYVEMNLNIDLFKYFFFNNRIHTTTDEIIGSGGKGQFRTVGWNFFLGVRPFKYVDIYYEHHSQHLLDHEYPYGRFPVNDGIGIKIHVYDKYRDDTIF